jgi:hypothetical protein
LLGFDRCEAADLPGFPLFSSPDVCDPVTFATTSPIAEPTLRAIVSTAGASLEGCELPLVRSVSFASTIYVLRDSCFEFIKNHYVLCRSGGQAKVSTKR